MDSAARTRWMVLSVALLATIVAIFYPVDDEEPDEAAPPVNQPAAGLTLKALVSVSAAPAADPLDVSGSVDDPFAPRGWQAPPPALPPAPREVATVVVAGPPEPVAPPPLPYRFVGRLDGDGGQVVYLARGEQAIVARLGEVLDGSYKVVAVNASQIEFEHLPSAQKQALVFPARDN